MFVRNRSHRLCMLATTLSAGLLLCMSVRAECESGETVVSPSENVNYVQAPVQAQPAETELAPPAAPTPHVPRRGPATAAPTAPSPSPAPAPEQAQQQNVPNEERPFMRGENPSGALTGRLENSALEPLSFMVGNWSTEVHTSADAEHAPNTDLRGFETIRPALNGNALIGNCELQGPNNMSFRGHLVIMSNQSSDKGRAAANSREGQPQNVSADNTPPAQPAGAQNSYSVFWADSTGGMSFTNDATWDGATLTVNGTKTVDGKQEKYKTTYTRGADNRIDVAMDRDTGNGWKNEFKGTMNRAGRMMQGENRPGAETPPPAPSRAAPPPPSHAAPPPPSAQTPNAPPPPAAPAPETTTPNAAPPAGSPPPAPPAPSAPQSPPSNQPRQH